MIAFVWLVLAFRGALPAAAQCPESWDGPTSCFNRLGAYPQKLLHAERGLSSTGVLRILGEPSSRATRTEPSRDYPGFEDRVIVTFTYPRRSVTLSRAVRNERLDLDRFEEQNVSIRLGDGCELRNGQSRREVLRLLGFDPRRQRDDHLTWHHQWCERGSTYEEWATVTLHFRADRLAGIVWEYWAD